eukprot:scaffold68128_cov63-Phaeocystis_antarctica.AAC.2
MVPRGVDTIDGKRQQCEPEADEARGVPRVDDGDGRLEDALARAHVVAQLGERCVHAAAIPPVERCLADGGAQLLQCIALSVGARHILVVLGAAEEGAQAAREGGRLGGGAAAPVLELTVARVLVVHEGVGLAHERAALVDDVAPDAARVVPARVARVGAEDEEQTERGRGQREDRGGDVVKVDVACGEGVPADNERGDSAHEGNLLVAGAQYARGERRAHHLLEALRRAVLDPVGTGEDGAAVRPLRLLELRPDGRAALVGRHRAILKHAAVARNARDRTDAPVLEERGALETPVSQAVRVHRDGDARGAGDADGSGATDAGSEGRTLCDVGLGRHRVLAVTVVGLPEDGVRRAAAEGLVQLRLGQPVAARVLEAFPRRGARSVGRAILDHTSEHRDHADAVYPVLPRGKDALRRELAGALGVLDEDRLAGGQHLAHGARQGCALPVLDDAQRRLREAQLLAVDQHLRRVRWVDVRAGHHRHAARVLPIHRVGRATRLALHLERRLHSDVCELGLARDAVLDDAAVEGHKVDGLDAEVHRRLRQRELVARDVPVAVHVELGEEA